MHDEEYKKNSAYTQKPHHPSKPKPDKESVPTRARSKQKTTAITLSVITCLFMGVIGYEIISENAPKHTHISPEDNLSLASEQPPPLIHENEQLSRSLDLLMQQRDELAQRLKEYDHLSTQQQETEQKLTARLLQLIASLEWEKSTKTRTVNRLAYQLNLNEQQQRSMLALLDDEKHQKNTFATNTEHQNKEINQLNNSLTEQQTQLLNLVNHLELERLRTSFLQKDLDRNRYVQRQNNVQHSEKIDHLNRSDEEKQTSLVNLVNHLEFERMRASFLQKDLDRNQYVQKQKDVQHFEEMNHLEHDIKKQQALAEKMTEELDNLATVFSISREQHRTIVDHLVSSHELASYYPITPSYETQNTSDEPTEEDLLADNESYESYGSYRTEENQEIDQVIANKNDRIHELQGKVLNLQKQVNDQTHLLGQKNLELAGLMAENSTYSHIGLHSSLIEKDREIKALSQARLMVERELTDHISRLESLMINEQFKNQTLQNQLREKIAQHASVNAIYSTFEAQLSLLNEELLNKETELLAREERLIQALSALETASYTAQISHYVLVAELETEKQKNSQLTSTLHQKQTFHALDKQASQKTLTEE